MADVLYLCNGNQLQSESCKRNPGGCFRCGGECMHTLKIEYARNFDLIEAGQNSYYVEREVME